MQHWDVGMSRKIPILFLSLLIVICCYSSQFVLSFPTQENNCLACHTNPLGIMIESNATVVVSPNSSFTIQVNASGNIGYDMVVKFPQNVADNNLFDFGDISSGLVYANDLADQNSNTYEMQVVYSIIAPDIPGSYTLQVFACQQSQFGVNTSIAVTVLDSPPSINNPPDVYIEFGQTDGYIEWQSSDMNPESYKIYENYSLIVSNPWNGTNVIYRINASEIKTINCTLVLLDTTSQISKDSVFVFIRDTTSPSINQPPDRTIDTDEIGQSISWTGYDLRPEKYEIRINGSIIDSGEWYTTNMVFILPLGSLDPGVYNCSITLFDKSQNYASDSVLVTILENTNSTPDYDIWFISIIIAISTISGLIIAFIYAKIRVKK